MPVKWYEQMHERGVWVVEVLCVDPDHRNRVEWRPVRESGKPVPYRWETKGAAVSCVQVCYPDEIMGETVRVRKV